MNDTIQREYQLADGYSLVIQLTHEGIIADIYDDIQREGVREMTEQTCDFGQCLINETPAPVRIRVEGEMLDSWVCTAHAAAFKKAARKTVKRQVWTNPDGKSLRLVSAR